jgi:hypothetical protein
VSRSVHVRFVLDTATDFSQSFYVLPVSPVDIIPPWLSTLKYHLGGEQQTRW